MKVVSATIQFTSDRFTPFLVKEMSHSSSRKSGIRKMRFEMRRRSQVIIMIMSANILIIIVSKLLRAVITTSDVAAQSKSWSDPDGLKLSLVPSDAACEVKGLMA